MTYLHDYTIELPVQVAGETVDWCQDVPCTLSIDESGDLWKVTFKRWGASAAFPTVAVMSGPTFDLVNKAFKGERDRILDECGFRGHRPEASEYTPIYGVGFSGGKYAA